MRLEQCRGRVRRRMLSRPLEFDFSQYQRFQQDLRSTFIRVILLSKIVMYLICSGFKMIIVDKIVLSFLVVCNIIVVFVIHLFSSFISNVFF